MPIIFLTAQSAAGRPDDRHHAGRAPLRQKPFNMRTCSTRSPRPCADRVLEGRSAWRRPSGSVPRARAARRRWLPLRRRSRTRRGALGAALLPRVRRASTSWPLAFVAWVPLFVAMHRQTTRRATLLGWLAGITMNVGGLLVAPEDAADVQRLPGARLLPLHARRLRIPGRAHRAARAGSTGAPRRAGGPRRSSSRPPSWRASCSIPLLFPWYFAATVHQIPRAHAARGRRRADPRAAWCSSRRTSPSPRRSLRARSSAQARRGRAGARAPSRSPSRAATASLRINAVDARRAGRAEATVGVVQAEHGPDGEAHATTRALRRHLECRGELREDKQRRLRRLERDVGHAPGARRQLQAGARAAASGVASACPPSSAAVVVKRVPDEREYVLYNTRRRQRRSRDHHRAATTSSTSSRSASTFPSARRSRALQVVAEQRALLAGHVARRRCSSSPAATSTRSRCSSATRTSCRSSRTTRSATRDPELLVNMTNDAWFGDTTEPVGAPRARAVSRRRAPALLRARHQQRRQRRDRSRGPRRGAHRARSGKRPSRRPSTGCGRTPCTSASATGRGSSPPSPWASARSASARAMLRVRALLLHERLHPEVQAKARRCRARRVGRRGSSV